ncbi:hypothetical protein BGZ63DRAFT_518452 [Mariannaea sp. PMI_226]|nr:hypothetical protein BGZ63DRAFT_518452 [Mariannaea sp. PMI_226]
MSSPGGSKKGRGRPRKETSEGDSSLRTLRARNRYAQTVFRARKRAAEAESEQRITRLEETIERMGDAFITLVDHIIHSNHQHQRNDPELNARLHSTMQTFLTLAAASSDPNPDPSIIGDKGSNISKPTPDMTRNSGDNMVASSTAKLEEAHLPQTASVLQPWTAPVYVNNRTDVTNQFDSLHSFLPGLTGSPGNVNIMGNGWTGDVPFSYTASLDQDTGFSAPQSISNLLIQATLYYVYYILLEAKNVSSSEEASNIFRYALRFHSRDELLFNLRWFLGPGQSEAHRLSKTGFQIFDSQGYKNLPILSPLIDLHALNDAQAGNTYHLSTSQTLINADGVEAYLLRRGFRRISQDIREVDLEVDVEESFGTAEALQRSSLAAQSDLLNADVFFPVVPKGRSRMPTTSLHRTPTTRTVRFSETRFLRLLITQASHCLAYGPGYRRDRLHDLIEAAAVY